MTKSKFKHVMIDLETLGTDPDCIVISLGAVEFDPDTGVQGREYYRVLSTKKQELLGRTKTQSTLNWWNKFKGTEAGEVLVTSECCADSFYEALSDFREWFPSNGKPWGNGANFDISILNHAYKQIGVNPPWRFWNIRDVRTVVDMASLFMEKPKEVAGIAHNALDDAKHQAKYVSEMWQVLREDWTLRKLRDSAFLPDKDM